MIRRLRAIAGVVTIGVLAMRVASARQAASVAPAAAPDPAIVARLASFDLSVRTDAARDIRRWPREAAVPLLVDAARSGKDEYVRYRALVLLAGLGGEDAAEAMRALMGDANDRLRAVAYDWFEHHPDGRVRAALVHALGSERSEFVRPALIRAVAASGDDPSTRAVLTPLVTTGDGIFRAAAIRALGDYHAMYAGAAIAPIAREAGPLQAEAIDALGKLGDAAVAPALSALESSAPRAIQPEIAVALCLLGVDATRQAQFVAEALTFAARADSPASPAEVEGAAHAMGELAIAGRADALDRLFDAAEAAPEARRAPILLAVGFAALRQPGTLLAVVQSRKDQSAAIATLHEAFDMLSEEDFELECFYVEIRHAYWTAADGSPARQTAAALIDALEF